MISDRPGGTPAAAIFGVAGLSLTDAERVFFRRVNPLGFILFHRNCESPDQVRALVSELRQTVGDQDAPVLIDQEGGRVQRLKPPHWRAAPPQGAFAELDNQDPDAALDALKLNTALICEELRSLGISVNCWPVLDLPLGDADPIIGDRVSGRTVGQAARLGRALMEVSMARGITPIIKHIPGHGRARVDSHLALPRVEACLADLEVTDFAPFRRLNDAPWAMTAHIVYEAIDPDRPATLSSRVIAEVIRGGIGFEGLLITDDLSMKALAGDFQARTRGALEAGCDVVLHCNGDMAEMTEVADAVAPLTDRALAAHERGLAALGEPGTAPNLPPDLSPDVPPDAAERVADLLGGHWRPEA